MASIQLRKRTNTLIVDFYYRGKRYREQTALGDSPANRIKVQKLVDRIEADIAAGTFNYIQYFPTSPNARKAMLDEPEENAEATANASPPASDPVASSSPAPLFRDFAQTWYAEKEVEWRDSYKATVNGDVYSLLIPHFGEKVVSQITKADILAFRAQLSKVTARGKDTLMSSQRINKIFIPLRQILNEAADRFNFLTPFQNVKPLKFRKSDIKPFSLEEARLIIGSVRHDYKNYYTVRFFTGMRTGEVDGLKWKYVDFDRRQIMVRETIVNGKEEYTKTDGSQRDIQMSSAVYEAMKQQESATRKISEYVFCNLSGTPLNHRNVTRRVWYPLLRHLDLDPRRPYQCRHTAATLWLASGENPEWIARQMGHTTTEMLFRVYSRFIPNLTRQDGSAFERLLLQGSGARPHSSDMVREIEEESHE